ncbi:colicin V production protein [Microcella putealis]|uniref:Colicin V production protein n=1 Tax=Microcella putealis TaxID=337005 RepID=A0A4Q7LV72_9MICO|nr:MarP family serine protease [Microcella putealis]RZS57619.1 colicin V production protein [Microcella putealis]TQM24686.1 colicin V production protein [Microcella putealis]
MTLTIILDVVLIIAIIGGLVRGARAGFVFTLGATIGAVVGAVAAVFLVPLVSGWVPDPVWRPVAALGMLLVLITAGLSLGEVIGHALRRGVVKALRPLDRVAGFVAGGIVAILVMALAGSTVTALGIPVVSSSTANSAVLRTIDRLTPDPVARAIAALRGAVVDQGIPRIAEAFGSAGPVSPPAIDAGSAALTEAAASVGRVTGAAYACGQIQSGTAFVIGPDRLLTNAHVVAGVDTPLVELPGAGAREGRIVYFDPQQDIAVIAIDGLDARVLPTATTLERGDVGAVQGYPFGGRFQSGGAEVVAVGEIAAESIDGSSRASRDSYTLAATVNPGNSGGPVLTLDGAVAGMVYAKAQLRDDIGYAHTMAELDPVIAAAPTLSGSVESGSCRL